MDEIDYKIKNLLNKFYKPNLEKEKESCPGDRLLACYIDGLLREEEKDRIEQHLLVCSNCLELVILHEKVSQEEAHETIHAVPMEWIERAKNLLLNKEIDTDVNLFDIVLKFAKETIEVIRNPGNLSISYMAIPVPIRGEKKILPTNLITLSKTFSDVESEVEIERVGKVRINMRVMTKGTKSGLPLKGLRISLCNPSREIASRIPEGGEVYFAGLWPGEYHIKITQLGREIGQISLNLKE